MDEQTNAEPLEGFDPCCEWVGEADRDEDDHCCGCGETLSCCGCW